MPTQVDRGATPPNPHRNKFYSVYVNEIGRRAMLTEKNPQFPVGSVIVKEKLLTKESAEPELLTVMLKRERGFNVPDGDWEYLVADGSGTKIEGRGKLVNCQSCHASRREMDYTFRSYLPDEVRRRLQ
jgi:hypothetical protein